MAARAERQAFLPGLKFGVSCLISCEAEVTQRPLRKWRKKHAGAGVASRRDPKQGRLL
jgi:hypothetical protein